MFRRRIGDRFWHFSPSCGSWPGRHQSIRLSDDEYPEVVCPDCEKIMLGRVMLLDAIAD